jgi:putative FmdB family regulatory protein
LPLYEYRCTACGYSFEKIQSFSAEPESECPKCQGVLVRPVTAPALRFAGAGWYVNDYAGKGGAKKGDGAGEAGKGAEGATEGSSAESKSDSKAGSADSKVSTDSKPATAAPAAAPATAGSAASGS